MQRSALLLLALATLATTVRSQNVQVQSGLLYWCSFVEGGTSYAAYGPDLPRTYIQDYLSQNPTIFSAPCHMTYSTSLIQIQLSDDFAYNYTNGTAYPDQNDPTNIPLSPYLVSPASCLTADNWATDPQQCMVPGFGYTPLYVNNGQVNPIASFPITYDQKNACGNMVYTAPLVDITTANFIYGQLYIWKDYSDFLYVTVSLNATIGNNATLGPRPPALDTSDVSSIPPDDVGQFLFTSPSAFNPTLPSGQMTLWNDFISNQLSSYNYAAAELLTSGIVQSWSCFTFRVNLKTVCNPRTSIYSKVNGCVLRSNPSSPGDSADVSNSNSLFLTLRFNFTRYYFDNANSLYCGSSATASTTDFEKDQVMAVIGDLSPTVTQLTTIDLYNSEIGLPKGCSTMTSPPAPL